MNIMFNGCWFRQEMTSNKEIQITCRFLAAYQR